MLKKIVITVFTFLAVSASFAQENSEQEFKPQGKVIGQVFGDYMYAIKADTTVSNAPNTILNRKQNSNRFILRNFHLGYEYYFSPKVTARLLMDVDENSLTSDGKLSTFVKDAWIKWNVIKNHNLIFGVQDVLQLNTCEGVWGHRYLEKSIADLRGLVGGREFGVSFRGSFEKIGYGLMVANGNGLEPESEKYKRYFFDFEYKPIDNLNFQFYADLNTKPSIGDYNRNEFSAGMVAGYTFAQKYTIGVDGYIRNAQNGYIGLNSGADVKTVALSTFAYAKLSDKDKLVFRYDFYEPNNNSESEGDIRGYIVAAYEYSPIPNFQISPNILIESYEKINSQSIDPSVWARITLSWTIN